jgi:hypothetical protein
MNYQEILKSHTEKEEEIAQEKAKSVSEEITKLERENWLKNPVTLRILQEIEKLNRQKYLEFLQCVDVERLHTLQIEARTIRKTLNLIKYARYDDAVNDGTTNR